MDLSAEGLKRRRNLSLCLALAGLAAAFVAWLRSRSVGTARNRNAAKFSDPARVWAEGLKHPKYTWERLLSLRVLRWAMFYGVRGVARWILRTLGVKGLKTRILQDEWVVDMDSAILKRRPTHMKPENLENLIGNTPMLAISFRYLGHRRVIYAKAEQYNLSGSIKDRMAFHIIKTAYRNGAIQKGNLIVEASSGNTGISFSAVGRALGHPVAIYMPDWMSSERKSLISSYGAQIINVSALQGGFIGSIKMSEEMALKYPRKVFLPRQFCNAANPEAHELSTGPEIALQLASRGLVPEAFAAGVGTGGTVMGVSRCLKKLFPKVRVHPVEPAESPTLSVGEHIGEHRIQGISDEFVPPIMSLQELASVIPVPDGDAIRMAQKLTSELGLGVGISSGANFLAALEAQERLGVDAVVVTIFCDDNKKYLSTDLARKEPLRPGYRSHHVELIAVDLIEPLDPEQWRAVQTGGWQDICQETVCKARAKKAQRKPRKNKSEHSTPTQQGADVVCERR